MNSLSDSWLSYLNTLLQWLAPLCTGGAVAAAICLIFVRTEIGTRQQLRISELTLQSDNANKEIAVIQSQAAKDRQEADTKIASLNVQAESLRADAENAKKEIATVQAQADRDKQEAETKIAELNKHTEALKAETEKSKKEIAVAQAQAAQANEKAQAERLARTQLEATMVPRVLISTFEASSELDLFAGTNVIIEYPTADREAEQFVEQLGSTLETSGWIVIKRPSELELRHGVHITSNPLFPDDASLQQKLDDAATILSYQLTDDGIENRLDTGIFPWPAPVWFQSMDTIFVRVGAKPKPYLEAIIVQAVIEGHIKANARTTKDRAPNEQGSGQPEAIATPYDKANRDRIIQRYTPKPTDKHAQ